LYNSNSYNLFKFQEDNMKPFYVSKHLCSYDFISVNNNYNKTKKINNTTDIFNYTDTTDTKNITITLR